MFLIILQIYIIEFKVFKIQIRLKINTKKMFFDNLSKSKYYNTPFVFQIKRSLKKS